VGAVLVVPLAAGRGSRCAARALASVAGALGGF